MLPRWHLLLGILFTALVWAAAPEINLIYLAAIFFAAFFIDFDHYINAVIKTKKLGLFKAFGYHRELKEKQIREKAKGIRKKGDFHVFHTVELHVIIGLLGILWVPLFYLFIGMVFHSLMDLIDMLKKEEMYRREFFLTNWLRRKF